MGTLSSKRSHVRTSWVGPLKTLHINRSPGRHEASPTSHDIPDLRQQKPPDRHSHQWAIDQIKYTPELRNDSA